MKLDGSCHCKAVRFSLESNSPSPYQLCYCSICWKTNGSGGYGINIGGDKATLKVEGEDYISQYHARIYEPDSPAVKISQAERAFCKACGSHLWLYDERWPQLVHPYATAIDTPLPVPPERTHIMLKYKPCWVVPDIRPGDNAFEEYPKESLAEWHERTGLNK